MERRLIVVLGGLTLVLAVTTATLVALFVAPSLANTAFAQGGVGNGFNPFQMPCAIRGNTQASGGNSATGIALTGNRVKDAEAAGLAFYAEKYGDKDVTVKATDYGCHVQADVLKGGKVVKSLGYDGAGGVYELN